MVSKRSLKLIHIASTGWFVASSFFLVIAALREAGLGWWIIFSISGHSGVLIFFLTLVYSFAIFRGVSRSQMIITEHPLTCSKCYLSFYDITPFLGAIAGLTVGLASHNGFEMMVSMATGTLCSTFISWIIVDPGISMAEMLLPASIKHRKIRIAEIKQQQEQIKEEKEKLMKDISEMESANNKKREIELKDKAVDLARLLAEHTLGFGNVEAQVVEIGGQAWQHGGIECMRQLCEITERAYKEKYQQQLEINHISLWWDGIGSWRHEN